MKSLVNLMVIILCAAGIAPCVRADVITLNGDKQVKGIIDESASDSKAISFTTATGTIKILKERIKKIDKEPPAQGYAHIGDEFKAQNKLDEAIQAYQKALKADPKYAPAQQAMKATQDAIDAKRKAMRQDAIGEIDKLRVDIRKAIHDGEFEKAQDLLKSSSDLLPTENQKAELQKEVTNLYLSWAKDLLDKFDTAGAESKLNLALAADPNNDEVIHMLLDLWEKQPEKQEQMLQIYETVLKKREDQKLPDDTTMRHKLADLYFKAGRFEPAATHYLKLYKGSEKSPKGSPLEEQLIDTLDKLQLQYASAKKFDEAIYFYSLLMNIDRDRNPAVITYYKFLKRASSLSADDIQGRLDLATFAEQNGMDQEALDQYHTILQKDPDNDGAKKALDRYAMALVHKGDEALAKQDYFLARAIADQVSHDFPTSKEANDRALDITGRANAILAQVKRESRDQAMQYVQAGNDYYQQAMGFYRDMFNTDINARGLGRLSNPKSDAIRMFTYAVNAYEAALKVAPELANDPAAMVGPKLNDSRQYLSRLTAGPPPERVNFGQTLGPNTPRSSESSRR